MLIEESMDRVPNIPVDMRTRFKGRAEKRAKKLNAQRYIPSYRYEVVQDGKKYEVVCFQNYARSA